MKKTKRFAALPSPVEYLRFKCPCGAALRIPKEKAGGHGVCPKCKRRLLLGTRKVAGKVQVAPSALGRKDPSGQTFLIENTYRIEDHFKEIPGPTHKSAPSAKISFRCPCYKKLAVAPKLVDRRVKCPHCGARLLLVGKTHPRTKALEIHPLVVEAPSTGDTMLLD